MVSLAVLAASLLAAPSPRPGAVEAILDQYPSRYLAASKSAAVVIELIITTDGKIAQCRELAIAGNEDLGRLLCGMQSARFWRVATDARGKPVDGVFRTLISMRVPGTDEANMVRRQELRPDVELTVNRLPVPEQEKLDIAVSVEVDATGAVVDCAVNKADIPAPFAKLACDGARQLRVTDVAIAGVRLPRFVINQKVRFVLSGRGAAAAN